MNTNLIQHALKPLVGHPLRSMGRAANLLWLHFGKMREVSLRCLSTKMVGDWAIHVQCAWRLCRAGRIVVAYGDYYYSPDGDALDDWDTPGKNRFDWSVAALNHAFATVSPFVLSFTTDDVGGFSLALSQDYRFDVFPDDSGDDEQTEHWRLFEPQLEREHFVVP